MQVSMAAVVKSLIVLILVECWKTHASNPLGGSLSLVDAEAGSGDGPDEGLGLIPLSDAEPLVPVGDSVDFEKDRLWNRDFSPAQAVDASSAFLEVGGNSSSRLTKLSHSVESAQVAQPQRSNGAAARATSPAGSAKQDQVISGDPLGIMTMNLPLPPQPQKELFGGNPLWTARSEYASRKEQYSTPALLNSADGNETGNAGDMDSMQNKQDTLFQASNSEERGYVDTSSVDYDTVDVDENWRASEQRVLRLARKTASILFNTTNFTKLGKRFSVLVAGTNQISQRSTAHTGQGNATHASGMQVSPKSSKSMNQEVQTHDHYLAGTDGVKAGHGVSSTSKLKHADPMTSVTFKAVSSTNSKDITTNVRSSDEPAPTKKIARRSSKVLPSAKLTQANPPHIPDMHRKDVVVVAAQHKQHALEHKVSSERSVAGAGSASKHLDRRVGEPRSNSHVQPIKHSHHGHYRHHGKLKDKGKDKEKNYGSHKHHNHQGRHGHHHKSHHDHHGNSVKQTPQAQKPGEHEHNMRSVAKVSISKSQHNTTAPFQESHHDHSGNGVKQSPKSQKSGEPVHGMKSVVHASTSEPQNDETSKQLQQEEKEARKGRGRFHLAEALAPDVPAGPIRLGSSDPNPLPRQRSTVKPPTQKQSHPDGLHLSPLEVKALNVEYEEGAVIIPDSTLKSMPLPTTSQVLAAGPSQWKAEAKAQPIDAQLKSQGHQDGKQIIRPVQSRWHNRLWTETPTTDPRDMGKASATKKADEHSVAKLQPSMEAPQSLEPSTPLDVSATHLPTPPLSTKNIQQDADLSVVWPAEQSPDVGEAVQTAHHQSRWHLWDGRPSIHNENQKRETQNLKLPDAAERQTTASLVNTKYFRRLQGKQPGENAKGDVKQGLSDESHAKGSSHEPIAMLDSVDATDAQTDTVSAVEDTKEDAPHSTLTSVEEQAFAVEQNVGAQPKNFLTFALDKAMSEAVPGRS